MSRLECIRVVCRNNLCSKCPCVKCCVVVRTKGNRENIRSRSSTKNIYMSVR